VGGMASAVFFQAYCAGPLQRLPNNTLQMPATPPVMGYQAFNAFGNLTFTDPVAIASPPGETNRLFVIEQTGVIVVITNLASPTRTIFLDLTGPVLGGSGDEQGLLGLAFHPGYATNGWFYVFYTGNATNSSPGGVSDLHDILSRFTVSQSDPNQADAESEVVLIAQWDEEGNHNAGDLHFGPDGYLYVSLGDEGGADDNNNNSQRINQDFFSGILRIDVDHRPGNLAPNPHLASTTNYAVPSDNPFVGATSFNGSPVNPGDVRTEFWAVGLRNPWRFSFDSETGDLYCADVGQGTWEEVDIITRGGNYGWAYREGAHPGPKSPPPGFTHINPIQEYSHGSGPFEGFAVTGGVVYRGMRLSQLFGAYVFADYNSGNVWALRYNGTNVTSFIRLFGEGTIAAFGIDPSNGDVLMANQGFDTIRRLNYSSSSNGVPLPATLAATGAFTNLATLTPHAGIVPYDINAPFWSDNAVKTRWVSVPNTNLTITFNRDSNWLFPTGTIWIKHFDLELTNGVPESRKRIETRFLVKNTNGLYGATYRWGNSTTNATLVADQGMDETFIIDEGGGIQRTQVWHYPSRQECLSCHTLIAGYALGFSTPQLNRDRDYTGVITNQIAALSLAGYFNTNVTGIHTMRSLANSTNAAVSLEYRVRSYLAANCVQCHQPGGSAQALWDARISTPTELAGLVDGTLLNQNGDPNNRVFKPGSLVNSMILTRISTRGPGQMPPLASTVVDTQSVALVSAWITNDLPNYQSFPAWQIARFGSTNAPEAAAQSDPDRDSAVNYLEYLTGTDPEAPASFWQIGIQRAGNNAQLAFPQIANRGFEVQSANGLPPGASWATLDVVGNEPFFSITNRSALINVAPSSTNNYYRIRVFAP
jgi:glucose/arabinose dehydrogenase/mono/diheme cytochrome c family protein